MSNASISNAFVSNASILNKSQSNAIPTISNASDYAMAATAQQEREMESHVASNIDLNTPIIIEGFENTNDLQTDNNSNITEMLQQILRMLAVLNLSHKEVKQRLKKLEVVVKTSYPQRASDLHQDCEIMKEFLPFTTIDAVQEFDKVLLRTKEIAVQFRQFILKTGGNNPKDSIHRNLKKIFSNECAMQCSWKGLRNNFRISNLKVINILKGEITSQFSLTETEFDNIASEWFRFAKQRKEEAIRLRRRKWSKHTCGVVRSMTIKALREMLASSNFFVYCGVN
nr:PREDICTED: uncharacterized protein LOC105669186 [Linepithema humile]